MDFGLAPLEGYSVVVVAVDEGVDRRAQLGGPSMKSFRPKDDGRRTTDRRRPQ
jgi:hypothetical protein